MDYCYGSMVFLSFIWLAIGESTFPGYFEMLAFFNALVLCYCETITSDGMLDVGFLTVFLPLLKRSFLPLLASWTRLL